MSRRSVERDWRAFCPHQHKPGPPPSATRAQPSPGPGTGRTADRYILGVLRITHSKPGRPSNEFGDCLGRKGRIDHHDVGRTSDACDGCDVLNEVETQLCLRLQRGCSAAEVGWRARVGAHAVGKRGWKGVQVTCALVARNRAIGPSGRDDRAEGRLSTSCCSGSRRSCSSATRNSRRPIDPGRRSPRYRARSRR